MSKRLLLILAVILIAGGLYVRVQNGREATKLADALVAADKASQDTTTTSRTLRDFVATHMGARTDVTLTAGYERAGQAARAAAAAEATNSQIYAEAQRACAGKSDSITQARCNQDYLSKHLVNVAPPTPVPAPKLSDYQYKLRAPFWTPDLAGALFAGAIFALAWLGLGLMRSRR